MTTTPSDWEFLRTFTFGVYRFHLRFRDPVSLPAFKGSALRGVFGEQLKSVACRLPLASCDLCPLRSECANLFLFATRVRPEHPEGGKSADFPRPYLFRTPFRTRRSFKPGESLTFDMVLIGVANNFLPHIISAFQEAGDVGIGQRMDALYDSGIGHAVRDGGGEVGKTRGRFRVTRVDALRENGAAQPVFDGRTLSAHDHLISFDRFAEHVPGRRRVTLRLETPLWLKVDGKPLRTAPPFSMVIRNLAGRAMRLNQFCGGSHTEEYHQLADLADEIRLVDSSLTWEEIPRNSRRSGRVNLVGAVGTLTYEGDLAPYWPLLRLGEYINLGKETVFGCGRYRLVTDANAT